MEALTITVTLYIHTSTSSLTPPTYPVSTCDMSQKFPGMYVLLKTETIHLQLDAPDAFDIIAKQVEGLRKQKANLTEDAERQIAVIDDRIQQLLCIEHCPIEENDFPF